MKLLFVDGNNLMMRSFMGNGGTLETEDGVSVSAIFPAFRTLFKVATELRPARVFWFWDGGRSAYRKQIYPEYKERSRQVFDEAQKQRFASEMSLMRYYLQPLGVVQLRLDGQEADDLICAMTKIMDGEEIFIASGDRDFFQLISDKVKIYNFQDNSLVDSYKFVKKYSLMPRQWPLVRAISGDSSDNIKGVPSYGDVRSLEIVQMAGNFSRLAETAEKRTPKLAAALLENLELVERNLKLIDLFLFPEELLDQDELIRQLNSGLDLEFDKDAFWRICEERGFSRLMAESFEWENVYAG